MFKKQEEGHAAGSSSSCNQHLCAAQLDYLSSWLLSLDW
jgi:hypothetical protein